MECVRWGNGVAVVGSTLVRKATSSNGGSGSIASPWSPAFWVLTLDGAGSKVSDEAITTGFERAIGVSRKSVTLLGIGSDLFVSAQTGLDTELLRLDLKQGTKTQKHYANAFLNLIRPVVPDDKIQLVGSLLSVKQGAPSGGAYSVVLITVDDRLEEISRKVLPTDMVTNVVYRMADQSLVMFGAQVHHVGEEYSSQVGRLDPTGQQVQTISPSRTSFTDTGMIYAAAPAGPAGRFAIATVAIARGYPDHPSKIEGHPGFLRGAALEFIDF
jgi:hypothetical protein